MKEFEHSIPVEKLNIDEKTRSNILSWRGQFSSQLVRELLTAYCPSHATVLDPFSGSGTVLHESALLQLEAYACDLNPAAWILSRLYEFVNAVSRSREATIAELQGELEKQFPIQLLLGEPYTPSEARDKMRVIDGHVSPAARSLLHATVLLVDVAKDSEPRTCPEQILPTGQNHQTVAVLRSTY